MNVIRHNFTLWAHIHYINNWEFNIDVKRKEKKGKERKKNKKEKKEKGE
jgi:hypothetical protein